MAASTYGLSSLFDPKDDYTGLHFRKYPTYCEVCFWNCAAWTHVDPKGNIVKLIGNDIDPHCNGRLCPRGTGGVGMYTDPDRLKTPLIRVKGAGGDSFREASWEEAFDLIAKNMKSIAEEHGPESIALLTHGSSSAHFKNLLNAFGSNTIGEPAYAQCRGPREAAFKLTFGSWVDSPEPTDIRDTRCMVLIGSHIGENMHNTQVQETTEAIEKGATIITVDPRASTIASKSDYWLPIKPSTDIALLLAWLHVIINEDLFSKEHVEKNTVGFEELKAHVQQYTPEWAYGITTLEPALIRKTAREMAGAAPAVIIHPGRHVTWYGDDTQRERAIAILNGLLGSWGKRGGFYNREKVAVPKFPHPSYPKPQWDWKNLAEKFPVADHGLSQEIVRASVPGENTQYKVKAWIVSGTNLIQSFPHHTLVKEAFEALDFIVAVDTMPMDITGYADVVLPECTYLERYDTIRASINREPSIALRIPAVEPKYNSKPSWWMAKEIGKRLGLEDYFKYDDFSEVLDWQLKKMGTSLEEMKKIGVKKFPRKSGPLYTPDNEEIKLPTASGKIELYSAKLEELGFDPLPVYTAHPEPEKGYYRLIYGRSPVHTFSRTTNNPMLNDLMAENKVWINPKVAKIWGLKNDQYIYLKNQDGAVTSFPIKIRVTERIRWDSVYMVHGFGHNEKQLSRAFGKGASDAEMITRVKVDPLMGGTGMRGNFVTFLTEQPGTVES